MNSMFLPISNCSLVSPAASMLEDASLVELLILEKYNLTKFLYFYFVDRLNHQHTDALDVLKYLDVSTSEFLFDAVSSKLVSFVFAFPALMKLQELR